MRADLVLTGEWGPNVQSAHGKVNAAMSEQGWGTLTAIAPRPYVHSHRACSRLRNRGRQDA